MVLVRRGTILSKAARSRKRYARARRIMRAGATRYKYSNKSGLSRAIQRHLDKRVETKQLTVTKDEYFNSGITSVNEFYPLIPPISQGVGDSQRLGQKVRLKYLKIKGVVSYELSVNATNNFPVYVDMFILQDKIQRSQNNPPNSYQILTNGSSAVTYNGDQMVAQYPVDTENWRLIKRKRIKLALNYAPGASSSTLTDPIAPIFRTFSIKIPVYNKIIDYESAGSTLPQNTNFWFTCGFFQYTNTTQTLGTPVRVNYTSTVYYKDD